MDTKNLEIQTQILKMIEMHDTFSVTKQKLITT
jgi:hypothetical protein